MALNRNIAIIQFKNIMNDKRYIVVNRSLSAHCCFEYTIVDTHAGKEDYGDYWKRSMCETFFKDEAAQICNALNLIEDINSGKKILK